MPGRGDLRQVKMSPERWERLARVAASQSSPTTRPELIRWLLVQGLDRTEAGGK